MDFLVHSHNPYKYSALGLRYQLLPGTSTPLTNRPSTLHKRSLSLKGGLLTTRLASAMSPIHIPHNGACTLTTTQSVPTLTFARKTN